jgi:hypothetical protein
MYQVDEPLEGVKGQGHDKAHEANQGDDHKICRGFRPAQLHEF